MQALNDSEELLHATWNLDADTVAKGVDRIHQETASILRKFTYLHNSYGILSRKNLLHESYFGITFGKRIC